MPSSRTASDDDAQPQTEAGRRTILWALPAQAPLMEEVIRRAGLTPVAVGSPQGAYPDNPAQRIDDIRHAAHTIDHDLILLATTRGLGDLDARRTLLSSAREIITLEPLLGGPDDLPLADAAREVENPSLLRHTKSLRCFLDVRDDFGPVHAVSIIFRQSPLHGSLHARLFDALDTLEILCGPVEQIDAALAGVPVDAASIASWDGHLTLNARFTANCAAAVCVSNQAGSWFRGVTVLGPGGCVRLTDGEFEWLSPEGVQVDSARDRLGRNLPGPLLAREIKRILDPRKPPADLLNLGRLTALCEAVRLSAVTGECASPRKISRMLGLD